MEWGNRDTKFVEQVNILTFSKLLSYSESFFHDAIVYIFVGYTKLYDHREKADVHQF